MNAKHPLPLGLFTKTLTTIVIVVCMNSCFAADLPVDSNTYHKDVAELQLYSSRPDSTNLGESPSSLPKLGAVPAWPSLSDVARMRDILETRYLTQSNGLSTLAVDDIPIVEQGFSIDADNRELVRLFYNTVYQSSEGITSGWDGAIGYDSASGTFTGTPGTTTDLFKKSIQLRLNYFRAMAGVASDIVFDDVFSSKSQQAALMMSSGNQLSHYPATNWPNYTEEGAEAASNSNISLGYRGYDAVTGQMEDNGSNNVVVGHRRWILYPQTKTMGTGDVDASISDGYSFEEANSVWVFDDKIYDPRPDTRETFVAWPAPGYVPYQVVYPRWSFAVSGADFSQATVSMVELTPEMDSSEEDDASTEADDDEGTDGDDDDTEVVVEVAVDPYESGAGENTLVFRPFNLDAINEDHTLRGKWEQPEQDRTFQVTIENVLGSTQSSYQYNVVVIDPAVPGENTFYGSITGPTAMTAGTPSDFELSLDPNATGYGVQYGTVAAHTQTMGAESTDPDIGGVITTGGYQIASSLRFHTGAASYHLAHIDFADEGFELPFTIIPSTETTLDFMEHIGPSTESEIREIQVSINDGVSWTPVFSVPGDGNANFTLNEAMVAQRVSIADFAGYPIRIRFLYRFVDGGESYTYGGDGDLYAGETGWFIDDIVINAAQILENIVQADLDADTTETDEESSGDSTDEAGDAESDETEEEKEPVRMFTFDPTGAGNWMVFGRSKYFESFYGDWCVGMGVTVTE